MVVTNLVIDALEATLFSILKLEKHVPSPNIPARHQGLLLRGIFKIPFHKITCWTLEITSYNLSVDLVFTDKIFAYDINGQTTILTCKFFIQRMTIFFHTSTQTGTALILVEKINLKSTRTKSHICESVSSISRRITRVYNIKKEK